MSDDSSFEHVGLDDLESVAEATQEEERIGFTDEDANEQKITFELPETLLQDTRSARVQPAPANTGDSNQSASGSSSILPVEALGRMMIKANPSDDESWGEDSKLPPKQGGDHFSSWNSSCTYDASEDASVAASSIISGFDLISLSGATKRRCKRCSYMNGDQDAICEGCGVALLANPCMELDEQIARQLQLKEEELAFEQLKSEEKKRKGLGQQTLFVQAQALTSDILRFVETCKIVGGGDKVGFCTLPEPSLVILASRFIEYVDTFQQKAPLSLSYHFTGKFDCGMTHIRQNGFGPSARFSSNADAALQAVCRPSGLSKPRLEAIPENATSPSHEANYLGWIVATVDEEFSILSGTANIKTVANRCQSLPLVCFDATLREHDIVRRLFHGLLQTCNDFFLRDLSLQETEDEEELSQSQCKKQKGHRDDVSDAVAISYDSEADAPLAYAYATVAPAGIATITTTRAVVHGEQDDKGNDYDVDDDFYSLGNDDDYLVDDAVVLPATYSTPNDDERERRITDEGTRRGRMQAEQEQLEEIQRNNEIKGVEQSQATDDTTETIDAAIAMALQESFYELDKDATDETVDRLLQLDFQFKATDNGEAKETEEIKCVERFNATDDASSLTDGMDAMITRALQEYESGEEASDETSVAEI